MKERKKEREKERKKERKEDMGVMVVEEVKGKDDMYRDFGSTAWGLTMRKTKGSRITDTWGFFETH